MSTANALACPVRLSWPQISALMIQVSVHSRIPISNFSKCASITCWTKQKKNPFSSLNLICVLNVCRLVCFDNAYRSGGPLPRPCPLHWNQNLTPWWDRLRSLQDTHGHHTFVNKSSAAVSQDGWTLTQQDFHAAYVVPMNGVQQGSASVLESTCRLTSEQTILPSRWFNYTQAEGFDAAGYVLYPIVFINVNAAVDEHLQNICVSFTAGQGQGAFSPFGKKIGVRTLQGHAQWKWWVYSMFSWYLSLFFIHFEAETRRRQSVHVQLPTSEVWSLLHLGG